MPRMDNRQHINIAMPKPEENISYALADAARCAKDGDVASADEFLRMARQEASQAGIVLTDEQKNEMAETWRTARINGIGVALADAAKAAKCGNVKEADVALRAVSEYARETAIFLTDPQKNEMAETWRTARVNGIGVALGQAASAADWGNVASRDAHIGDARRYAEEAGVALTEEQEELVIQTRARAYEQAVWLELNAALLFARRGKTSERDAAIKTARECAREAGVALTEVQEDMIKRMNQNNL